jgi:hypothetical protein
VFIKIYFVNTFSHVKNIYEYKPKGSLIINLNIIKNK